MAQLRVWVWRFAMLSATITAVFFAWMTSIDAPVFDAVTQRAEYWQQRGFFLVQLGGIGLWLLAGLTAGGWRPAIKALAAGAVLFACLIAMASEYDSLILQGALRNPLDVAVRKLMVSRGLTLGLAVAGLMLGWWARPQN